MKRYIYPEAKLTQTEGLLKMESTVSKILKGTSISEDTTVSVDFSYEGVLTDASIKTCRNLLKIEIYKLNSGD